MIHQLEADSIRLDYGSRKVLTDVYIKCETGKITGLLGRNGNGKTSLLNIIYGNLKAQYKSVRFDDQPVNAAFETPELLVYLPQFYFMPQQLTLKRIFSDFKLEYSTFEQTFPEFKSKYKSTLRDLSSGQRRLVEIFAVIKSPSQFALLDEPFSMLSPVLIDTIKALMLEEKNNKGLLVTDHLYEHIIAVSDTLYVLANGKTHLIRNPDEIAFLGYTKSANGL
jgi:ABC-type multidrug transport system ATPase subunit